MKKNKRKELEQQLYKENTYLFSGRHEPLERSCMPFGIECGTGWLPLIGILSSCYTSSMKHNWRLYPLVRFVQIKEKFGGLRAYIDVTNLTEEQYRERWQAEEDKARKEWYKDQPDKWKTWDSEEYKEYLVHAKEGSITFHAWESMAEDLSFHICEDCGTMDNVTTGGDGWISTVCDSCRARNKSARAWWRPGNIKRKIMFGWKYGWGDKLRDFFKRKEKTDAKSNPGKPASTDQTGS